MNATIGVQVVIAAYIADEKCPTGLKLPVYGCVKAFDPEDRVLS